MLSIIKSLSVIVPLVSYVVYQARYKPVYASLPCALVGLNCPSNIPIHGFADEEYRDVYNVFVDSFKKGHEVGAAWTAYVDGKKVVSLQGGWQNIEEGIEYNENTLQMVFSSTKALSAIVIAQLVDQGLLSYDEKISTYWPEFAQGNKENVTLMDLMRHTAGVAALDNKLSYENVTNAAVFSDILAAQPHNFNGTPDIRCYHAITQGWYQNEIVRRVDPQHRTIDDFAREFKDRYGSEWYLKPDVTEGVDLERIAPFYKKPMYRELLELATAYLDPKTDRKRLAAIFDKDSLFTRIVMHPNIDQQEGVMNNRSPKYRSIEGPSYSGHTNADSMAKLAAMMAVKGKSIVPGEPDLFTKESTFDEATKYIGAEDDLVFDFMPHVNAKGGFLIFPGKAFPGIADEDIYFEGGFGVGGSLFLWNQKYNVGLAYTASGYANLGGPDVRTIPLVNAVLAQVIKKKQKSS